MFTNCVARAKLNYNKKLKTYKLLVAFCNANESITQRNSAFVSGDLCADTIATDLQRVLATAQATLRTNNIVIVE
jgi:CO/xanthine dehydrogenase FAD-binding subunit